MSQSELENVDGETRHSRPAGDGRSEVRAVAQHFLPFSSASLSGSRRRVRTPRTTQEGFFMGNISEGHFESYHLCYIFNLVCDRMLISSCFRYRS